MTPFVTCWGIGSGFFQCSSWTKFTSGYRLCLKHVHDMHSWSFYSGSLLRRLRSVVKDGSAMRKVRKAAAAAGPARVGRRAS